MSTDLKKGSMFIMMDLPLKISKMLSATLSVNGDMLTDVCVVFVFRDLACGGYCLFSWYWHWKLADCSVPSVV